jgi:two-component system chemotaxis response regulator CheY
MVPPMLTVQSNADRFRVLVVDDSPDMCRYLRTILELSSFDVETASNGSEALARLKEGCIPDVVLLDMQMPGIDGLKTLRRLRKLQPGLKVIMCSGVEDKRKIRRAASLGAQAYILKPIQQLYLSAALERCLSGSANPNDDEVAGSVVMFPPAPRYDVS